MMIVVLQPEEGWTIDDHNNKNAVFLLSYVKAHIARYFYILLLHNDKGIQRPCLVKSEVGRMCSYAAQFNGRETKKKAVPSSRCLSHP